MPSTPGPVIVVDDDAAVRDSLKFALELEGMAVRVYRCGRELLDDPDLPPDGCLVVDYAMPAMNGVELVDCLRQRDVLLPAILITSKASHALRDRAHRAGIGRVLEKPLDDSSLADSIRAALSSSG